MFIQKNCRRMKKEEVHRLAQMEGSIREHFGQVHRFKLTYLDIEKVREAIRAKLGKEFRDCDFDTVFYSITDGVMHEPARRYQSVNSHSSSKRTRGQPGEQQ